MKSLYILSALAMGTQVLATQLPTTLEVVARQQCGWSGHCLGDDCDTNNDCDGQLICRNGACASTGASRPTRTTVVPTPRPTACGWPGHCAGDECETYDDCDGQMICVSGVCAAAASGGAGGATSTRRPTSTTPTPTSTDTDAQPSTVVTPPTQPTGGSPSCGINAIACIGVSCTTDADCGFSLILCKNGVCSL
ncbi:hypothetical protein QBC46DRAFT_449813 [Diplogelasinospora grovesii]|uniref:Uncharacterized protein n=1 Tax=Diplogelasinospora grovesii TaxID=303347 RepID=A0AAN6N6Q8_9PEZI|nr:hypothetical protein QBC46DRAFT_449813 [Diplogelasinospora grovesii]